MNLQPGARKGPRFHGIHMHYAAQPWIRGVLAGLFLAFPLESYGPLQILDSLPSLRSLAVADLFGDGSTSLVVGWRPAGVVEIWEQISSGRWIRDTVLSAGEAVWEVLPCDLNGDGWMDLLASTGASRPLHLQAWYQTWRTRWQGPQRLLQDTLPMFPEVCLEAGRIALHANDPVMIFQWDPDTLLPVDSFIFSETYDLIGTDLSGDGTPDLVLGTPFGPMILYLSTSGTVDSSRLLSATALAIRVRAGDLDHDGITDLLAFTGSEILWWKGPTFVSGPQPLPAGGVDAMEVDTFSSVTRVLHAERTGSFSGELRVSFLSRNGSWQTRVVDSLPSYTSGLKIRAFREGLALSWIYLAVLPRTQVSTRENLPSHPVTAEVRVLRPGQKFPGHRELRSVLGRRYPLGNGGRVPYGIPSGVYWVRPTRAGLKALRILIP